MVAKLQYGGSFASTETNTISIRIIDEINFPAYLVAKFVNLDGALDARYNAFDEIRVFEDAITDDPVIFRGKVEKVLKAVENGIEILTITARDNLTELDVPFNDATYAENGADATINAIIRGHIKTLTNIDTPAVGNNTAAYQTSLNTNAVTVIGKNNGRSVLKTIQDLAAEDPWNANYLATTNTGWHFYLDGAVDFHYHQNGAYPSAPIGNGLRLKFGLATGSISDYYKEVLPSPSYSDFVDDIVSEIHGHYQLDGETKVVRLKLITFTNYDNSGGAFTIGNNISGTAEGGSGTATAQIRLVLGGALLVSHATDYTAEAPNFHPGAELTDAGTGATGDYTTTAGQETTQAKPVNLRRSTLVFNGGSGVVASALAYVSQAAYAVARAGFIDISADTHRKATIRIFDFPIFIRSSTTTVVRAGNQIYLEDSITPVSGSAVAENFTVSKIEYVQEGGKSISSLSLTTLEGSPIRTSSVEKARNIAKDAGIVAVDAVVGTSNAYTATSVTASGGLTVAGLSTASDGSESAPGITFSGSAGNDTGFFEYESGGKEYLGITANGTAAALFGENNSGIYLYENLNSFHISPSSNATYDLGYDSGGKWRKIWTVDIDSTNALNESSDGTLKDNIQPTNLGLDFINDLNPVSYKWKDETLGTSTHYGIIAQDVVGTLKNYGIGSLDDFAGITYNKESGKYSARYTEFIPILMKAIQELSEEIKELKEKL